VDFLYSIAVQPLALAYRFLYSQLADLAGGYTAGLLWLSLFTYAVLFPLKKLAASLEERERRVQAVLRPQLAAIKEQCRGAERQARVAALYRRYAYNPLLALRASVGLLFQVPFLIAAYVMLDSFEPIAGRSAAFGLITDLGAPDGLLGGLNVLPLIMAAVNILAVFTAGRLDRGEKLRGLLIAFLFLALLYAAPSALLIYWTGNNLLSLLENLVRALARCRPGLAPGSR